MKKYSTEIKGLPLVIQNLIYSGTYTLYVPIDSKSENYFVETKYNEGFIFKKGGEILRHELLDETKFKQVIDYELTPIKKVINNASI